MFVAARSFAPAKSTAILGLVAIPSLKVTEIESGLSSLRTNESAGTMLAVGTTVSILTLSSLSLLT